MSGHIRGGASVDSLLMTFQTALTSLDETPKPNTSQRPADPNSSVPRPAPIPATAERSALTRKPPKAAPPALPTIPAARVDREGPRSATLPHRPIPRAPVQGTALGLGAKLPPGPHHRHRGGGSSSRKAHSDPDDSEDDLERVDHPRSARSRGTGLLDLAQFLKDTEPPASPEPPQQPFALAPPSGPGSTKPKKSGMFDNLRGLTHKLNFTRNPGRSPLTKKNSKSDIIPTTNGQPVVSRSPGLSFTRLGPKGGGSDRRPLSSHEPDSTKSNTATISSSCGSNHSFPTASRTSSHKSSDQLSSMAEPSSPSSKSRAWSPSSPSSTSRHPPVPASSLRPPSLFDFPAASPLSSTTMFTPSPTHNAATLPRSNRDHIAANGTGDPAERVRLQHLADQPGKHHRQSRSFSHSNHKLSDLMVPPQSPLGAQAEEAKSGHARIGSKASPTGRLRSITAVNSSPVELAKISTTLATSITTLRDESISPKSADGPMAERSLSSDALSATATLSVPEFIVPRTAALAAAAPGGSASTLGRSRTWKLSNSLKNASAQPGGINALGKGPAGVSADVMALKTTPMDGTMSLGRSNRLAHATASQNGDSSSPNALQPYSSSVLSASTANFATEPLSAMTTGLGGSSVSANTSPTDAAVSGEKWVLVRNFTKYDSRKTSATAAAAATAVVAAAVEAGTPPPASVGDLLDIEAVHHHRHHHPPRGPIDTSVASGQPPIHQTRSNPVVLPTMTKPATAGTSEIFAPLDDMTGDELTSPISASLEIPPRISSASLGNGGGSSSTTKDNSGGGLPPSIHQLIQPTRKSSNQSGMISTVSSSSPFPSPSPSPLASTTSTSAAVAAAATTTHHHATGGNGSSGGGLSIQFLEDALARLPKLSREGSRGGDISQRLSTPSLEGLIQRVQNIAGGSNQHLHYIGNTGTAIGPSGFAANSQVQALDSMELADVITQSRKRLQYYRRLWQEVTEPDSDLTRWLQAQPTTTMPVTMATTTTFGKRSATPPTIINTGLRKLPLVKSSSSTPTTPLTTPPALDRSASASSSGGHTHGNGSSLFLSPKSRELIDQILNQGGGQVDSTGSKMPTGSASGPAAKPLTLSLSSSSSSSLSPSPSETPSPRPSGPGPATHPMVNYAASLSPPNLSSTGNIHEGSRNRSGSGNGNGGLPLSTSSRSATSLSSLTNGNLLHLPAANHGGAGDPRFRSYESISHSEVDSVDTNNFGGYFGSDPNLPLGTISNPLATEFGGKRGGSASAGSGNSAGGGFLHSSMTDLKRGRKSKRGRDNPSSSTTNLTTASNSSGSSRSAFLTRRLNGAFGNRDRSHTSGSDGTGNSDNGSAGRGRSGSDTGLGGGGGLSSTLAAIRTKKKPSKLRELSSSASPIPAKLATTTTTTIAAARGRQPLKVLPMTGLDAQGNYSAASLLGKKLAGFKVSPTEAKSLLSPSGPVVTVDQDGRTVVMGGSNITRVPVNDTVVSTAAASSEPNRGFVAIGTMPPVPILKHYPGRNAAEHGGNGGTASLASERPTKMAPPPAISTTSLAKPMAPFTLPQVLSSRSPIFDNSLLGGDTLEGSFDLPPHHSALPHANPSLQSPLPAPVRVQGLGGEGITVSAGHTAQMCQQLADEIAQNVAAAAGLAASRTPNGPTLMPQSFASSTASSSFASSTSTPSPTTVLPSSTTTTTASSSSLAVAAAAAAVTLPSSSLASSSVSANSELSSLVGGKVHSAVLVGGGGQPCGSSSLGSSAPASSHQRAKLASEYGLDINF